MFIAVALSPSGRIGSTVAHATSSPFIYKTELELATNVPFSSCKNRSMSHSSPSSSNDPKSMNPDPGSKSTKTSTTTYVHRYTFDPHSLRPTNSDVDDNINGEIRRTIMPSEIKLTSLSKPYFIAQYSTLLSRPRELPPPPSKLIKDAEFRYARAIPFIQALVQSLIDGVPIPSASGSSTPKKSCWIDELKTRLEKQPWLFYITHTFQSIFPAHRDSSLHRTSRTQAVTCSYRDLSRTPRIIP